MTSKYDSNTNFARIPDNKFNIPNPTGIPTVEDIIKNLDKGTYKVSRHEFLSDLFECGAIAISNKFDYKNALRREETYLTVIRKYDKDMQNLLTETFAMIFSLLISQINSSIGFDDYLGKIYMQSETSNNKAGQFFTPYSVSLLCADMGLKKDRIEKYIEEDEILMLNEPACGSAGMVLATADILYNKYHLNTARNFFAVCSDIDKRCVHMTYLQLALAGIPAIIYHQNALTLETWDEWKTPAYLLQWSRFRNCLKKKK